MADWTPHSFVAKLNEYHRSNREDAQQHIKWHIATHQVRNYAGQGAKEQRPDHIHNLKALERCAKL
ncbi:hypothetical protein SDC9_189245 [bioreactor metagenome]|uniref:Uncharacterized protein n=1 Tax=bioreactor metagenome TaxID=1076179 RepID=A0A645HS68_9ZZZZ